MSIKVNMSDQEAKSGEGTGFGLPRGEYDCIITDCELDQSQSQANPGKPLFKFRGTVQSGEYADQEIPWTACLWSGALYTIVGMLKAMGEFENCGGDENNLEIPDAPEFYLGKRLMVRRGLNKKAKEKNPEDDPRAWIEVRGFSAYEPGSTTKTGQVKAAAGAGILP
jgi:hypothetical protein